jgi:hydrogenase maturation protease
MGNVLMSDDGFGPYVVHLLEATYECPPGVEFVDVGTPGLDLTPYLLDADAVIFVDTVSSRGAPGEMRTYERDDILKHQPQMRTGPHDPALKEALMTVAAAGAGPTRAVLVGVIPQWIATGVALSPQVQAAVGRAVATVIRTLDEMGARPMLRAQPAPMDVWWARSRDERFATRDSSSPSPSGSRG